MSGDALAHETQVLEALLHLEQRAFAAATVQVLGFTIANETVALAPYRQAAFFILSARGKLVLETASGLASIATESPYVIWLTRFAASFPAGEGCHRLDFSAASAEVIESWEEWLPDHLLVAPLLAPDGSRVGAVMYARESPWSDQELAACDRLHRCYGYCLWALYGKRSSWRRAAQSATSASLGKALLVAALLALFIPVRLSVLAPAEVVALHALAVAAPQDGVISAVNVKPNALVKKGELLFSLNDSALLSRRDVALKALSIARADALVAQQRAFDDVKSKGDLAAIMGRVQEKMAELEAIQVQAARVETRAERDGVAVFGDVNDWLGRPVQTGERVMQIADPQDASVLMWLPVTDAINLEPGAPLRLFLHTKPLDPLPGVLIQTSYQALLSPDGVSAYRLRGQFAPEAGMPRIGLRGTARVSGEWATLGYYLLRRPIAALREWTGW